MNRYLQKNKYLILGILLFFVSVAIRTYNGPNESLTRQVEVFSYNSISIFIIVLWGVSVWRRILSKNLRQYLIYMTYFMISMMLFRVMRYDVVMHLTTARYMWYGYYLVISLFNYIMISHIYDTNIG